MLLYSGQSPLNAKNLLLRGLCGVSDFILLRFEPLSEKRLDQVEEAIA